MSTTEHRGSCAKAGGQFRTDLADCGAVGKQPHLIQL
eukprot:COSAG02_NODE_50984_length_317_cov_0.701835_1_plen_36_part_01